MTMVRDAYVFALGAHGNQKYGFQPYVTHLREVAALCAPYGDMCVTLAWLHDVLEDTNVKQEQLIEVFGTDIAWRVTMLTDPDGATRAERKKALNVRLASPEMPKSVLITKVADRLANVRTSLYGNPGMLAKYRGEHDAFRNACYRVNTCDPLWNELDTLIAGK